jgi:hypothetical protein
MVEALGWSGWKGSHAGCWVLVRKAWNIGPNLAQGSMVMGIRTILVCIRSLITSLPAIKGVVAVVMAGLLDLLEFLCSRI